MIENNNINNIEISEEGIEWNNYDDSFSMMSISNINQSNLGKENYHTDIKDY